MLDIQFKIIFDSSPLPIFVLQGQKFLMVNQKMEQLTGYTAQELMDMPFYDLVHPDDRQLVANYSAKCLTNQNTPEEYEFRGLTRQGDVIYARGYFTGIELDGCPAVLGQIMDITEKVIAERLLAKSQERYRLVVDNADVSIFIAQDGMIKFFNPNVIKMTGFTRDRITSSSFLEFIHPDHQKMVMERHYKRMRGEDVPQRYLFKIIDSQGEIKWAELNVVRITWEDKPASLCFMHDINEKKEMEEKLNQQRAYFQQLFENSPTGIAILDNQVRIIQINKGFETLFQYTPAEVTGRPINDLIVPDHLSHESKELSDAVLQGFNFEMETIRKRKDGSIVHVHVLGFPIVVNNKQAGIFGIYTDITERKRFEAELRESQRSLSTLLSNLPGMAYRCANNRDWTMEYISEGCLDLTGYNAEELIKFPYSQIIHDQDRDMVRGAIQKSLKESIPFQVEYRIITKNGNIKWVWEQGRFVHLDDRNTEILEGFITDISDKKFAEEALKESETKFRELADSLPEIVFELDLKGRVTYANRNGFINLGYTQEEFEQGVYATAVIAPEDRNRARETMSKLLSGDKKPTNHEYTMLKKDGSTYPALIHSIPAIRAGKPVGLRGIIVDITERKQAEERIKYVSLHDSLTGLYNRTYFEQEMKRLKSGRYHPVSIIVCDVDGLKIVNDTLGHGAGDELLIVAAKLIKEAFRDGDMVARIGGDEFAVLLPHSDETIAAKACRRIQNSIAQYNTKCPELPLSISVGYATTANHTNLADLFKEADNNMYREKLHRRQSARSAIVQTMMKALEARDFITEGHADRLQDLVVDLAKSVGLPEKKMADLRLLAQFHDIGKVGIPDRILFKKGRLTDEEKQEMQKHSEIGYRIALSAPDLAPIADWILCHHEWWNGEGYPSGLKEANIPIECRILAIADAFDAMTSDRPYRKALPVQRAVDEIIRCSGTQFDPALVKHFIEYINCI